MTNHTRDRYAHRSAEDIAEHDRYMQEDTDERREAACILTAAAVAMSQISGDRAEIVRTMREITIEHAAAMGGNVRHLVERAWDTGAVNSAARFLHTTDLVPNAQREALDALFKRPEDFPPIGSQATHGPKKGAIRAFLIGFALVAAYIAATIWAWGIPE